MRLLLLLASFLIISCSEKIELNGNWKLNINLQGKELPVIIKLIQTENLISGTLYNSSEEVELSGIIKEQKFTLDIGSSYAKLEGEFVDGKLTGHWIRTNKKDYKIAFTGSKISKTSLFKSHESKQNLLNASGNWKVKLDENKYGLGVFKQTGSRIQGSILTSTGDYRYLDGYIEKNSATLYGFDGTFSFLIELVFNSNQFQGHMYSGKSYNTSISADRDSEYSLEDPNEMTKYLSKKPLNLKLQDINGEPIVFNSGKYKGKAKIVQVFGSWCPNCIDETNFFVKWRKENQAKLNEVEIIAIAYEKFETKKMAIKNLRKMRHKIKMDYPLALGDYSSTKTVTKLFPIEKTIAFPTTFFLNRKNEVMKIHTGFSGQATGKYFKSFKDEFNETVNQLIKD